MVSCGRANGRVFFAIMLGRSCVLFVSMQATRRTIFRDVASSNLLAGVPRTHSARGRVKRSDSLLLARQKSYRRFIARETLRALERYAAIYRGTKKMEAFCGTWNIGRGNMETGGKTRYSRAKIGKIAVAIGNARFNAANRIS